MITDMITSMSLKQLKFTYK